MIFNESINNKIYNYCVKNEKETITIKLFDFTNFDWFFVIIFKMPISGEDIRQNFGIDYNEKPNLTSGMTFVKNYKIIYEDFFENPYRFAIVPFQEEGDVYGKINKFNKKNAIFNLKKENNKNENGYVLEPLQNIIGIDVGNDYYNFWVQGFDVENNVVKLKCHLSIYNNDNQEKVFYIRAKFEDDAGKLSKNENLMILENGEEKIFQLYTSSFEKENAYKKYIYRFVALLIYSIRFATDDTHDINCLKNLILIII